MADKEFDRTNRFGLFKNTHKTEETHADLSGYVNINGKEYWLNGWVKETPKGKMINGSVKPKEEKKDWIKPELRQKFQDVEERGDDSAKHEVVLDDDFDESEPVDMSQIPF